jgi:2-polyprenyl-6-methoxyphenol hydroxylase-like FAD-dependent oxidoreductase
MKMEGFSEGKRNVPLHNEPDVLIVGAGPTGLTLAAQLHTFGTRFRIIDRLLDRAHESRALAVQARSLEVLQSLGLGEELVARGRTSTRLMIHFGRSTPVVVRLGDIGAVDTRFPFILFVSQAETEAVLDGYLASAGVMVERGVELIDFQPDRDGVHCRLRRHDGQEEQVCASYLVGCDGAHSTVRRGAGIPFEGGQYPQNFVLGDVEVAGPLELDTVHSFPGEGGFAIFFPLGRPATWRVIAMEGNERETSQSVSPSNELSLEEMQAIIDPPAGGLLRLHDPAWLTRFHLHHRQAERYRKGRIFLAGDAAHIHSPAGAQGMNTGIQDAWNLGWKLALVARGVADDRLLDSYEAERWPIGRFLLGFTDRLFGMVTRFASAGPLVAWFRRAVVLRVISWVLFSRGLRANAFRIVSQLGIRYRKSPAVMECEPGFRAGPKAGDRLPDARVTRNGRSSYLQQELAGPHLHLLLCGQPDAWDSEQITELASHYAGLLRIHYLARSAVPGALVDGAGEAFARLGVDDAGQYLVRPDGHVGFRCPGRDLRRVTQYLEQWFVSAPAACDNDSLQPL